MIRHIVLMKWRPDADPAAVAEFAENCNRLPEKIPGVRRYQTGADIASCQSTKLRDNFDFGVVADFDDYVAFENYLTHEVHRTFVQQHVRPILEDRAAMQMQIDG